MTRADLDNPADFFANAAVAMLQADSPAFPFTVYGHRAFEAMDNNRVEILATGFDRASDHMDFANIAGNSTPFYNHGQGQIAFSVVSSRPDQQATDNHAYCVGRIATLCRRDRQAFVPYCQGIVILDLEDLGTAITEDEDTDHDRTTRSFRVEYMVPAAVYAAAT